jgi:hypothetical protein
VIFQVLSFDSEQKRAEPFEGAEITANPEEVHLPQSCTTLGVVHAVPDTLKNGGEGCDTDTGTDEHSDFEFEHVLRCRAEGTVDVDTRQDLAHGDFLGILVLLAPSLLLEVASERLAERAGEVTDHTDVNRDVVLLGGGSERERMVLPDRDLGAAEEDVLTGACCGVFFLDLDFANVTGVVDDLGDVGLVASAHFTRNALGKVGKSTIHPVLPEDTNAVAEGRKVGLDHAESAVNGPEHKKDDEHVMCVPETLEVRATRLLGSCNGNGHQREQHDVSTPTRSCGEVGEDETHESEFIECGEAGEVVPVSNSVDPGEEDDSPGDELVEGDVLVEWDDIIQWRTTGHRDEVPAHWKENKGYINVQYQSCRTGYGERCAELGSCANRVILCEVSSRSCAEQIIPTFKP